MRYFEIALGIRIPVSLEEQEILDLCKDKDKLYPTELNERQNEVARLMVGRELLNRNLDENIIYYTANSLEDLWRF